MNSKAQKSLLRLKRAEIVFKSGDAHPLQEVGFILILFS